MDVYWSKLHTKAGEKTPVCVERVAQGELKEYI